MLELFLNSYNKFSDRNAFCIKDIYYTYFQFAKIISKIRSELENNCKNEKLIAIAAFETPDIETYASIYACWFSGKGYVPMNPNNPLDRNVAMLNQTEIKTILSNGDDDNIKLISKILKINIINTRNLPEEELNLDIPNVEETDLAYILFTSGSTGIPKGVPITRGNVASMLDAFSQLNYNIDETDRFIQMFELTFDFSVFCFTAPLSKGACVYTVSSEGVKYANVYMALENYEITFACMLPSILTYLRPFFSDIKLEKIKYSLFCGEALLSEITSEWSKSIPNGKIINAYGPTEATVFCLIYDYCEKIGVDNYNGILSIGHPMDKMNAIVVNEQLEQVDKGAIGELCLAGDQLTSGYWNNSERNKKMFFKYKFKDIEQIFYRTGDLSFINQNNYFMFVGRLDSQVKIQGFRIELGEIEHFTREYTNIINVAAVAIRNKQDILQIHLFVENYLGNASDIEDYLKTKIPNYMIPSTINIVNNFPINTNGKIDRKKLFELIRLKY